jgi:hypothetical protein
LLVIAYSQKRKNSYSCIYITNNCYVILFLHLLVIVYHRQESISLFFLQGTCKIQHIHYHFAVSSFDPRTVVLQIFFYSPSLVTFIYIYIYIAALSGQLVSFYTYIVMKLLTKKGISRNKASLLSFDKLCNLSFFSSSCTRSTHMIDNIT